MISQHSPSELFQHLPRVTSTVSENIILFSSNNSLSTKVTNINISKLIAINDSGLVAESNMQKLKHSLLSSIFTADTPLTPNQNVTWKKSTGNSLLESNTRHSTYRAFSVSASQKTASKKTSSSNTSAPSTQLQNIFIQNAMLLRNIDLQNMTLKLPSLLARTQSKNKFLSSESEIPLSNIIPFPLVNISQGAKNPASKNVEYFKFVGTDTPKFERSKLPEVSTFATPKFISLVATFKSDMNSKKELKNVETNLNSTNNLELTDDSIPKISTTSAYSASKKTQLASQTAQNVSGDFISFSGIPVISSNETLHSERNMFENTSLSTDTATNFIFSFFNTNNSISKNISKPSLLIAKTNKRASDITTQPESIFLSTLINKPRTISALSETEAKSLLTLSPLATITTPPGTTVISHSKTPNTLSRYWIATFNKYAINKVSVSESSTESSSITAQENMLSGLMKRFTQSSSDTKDPNPKTPTSLYSNIGSSTASSFISSAETATSTSNSVHFTDSNVPQTIRVLIATSKSDNISVLPNPFISNNLTTTPSFFVGSPTSVSINKTTAANSFNISTNSAILSSASVTMAPTKHISVSSLTFVNEDILITPTINDTNTFHTGKQPQLTPSIITTKTILNPSISYTASEPIKHYINPSTAKSHLEINTPIYSIAKNNSLSSNTAMRTVFLIKPILATPITKTDKKPFLEQTVTKSQTLSKIPSLNLKAMYIPTTTEEVSISSTTFSKSLKSFIASPNIASTRPIPLTRPTPLTRTDSKLMRIVSRKSTPVPDLVSCDYNGRKFKIWEIFQSQDECNTCECLYDGMVHCSKFLCRDQKGELSQKPDE